MPIVNGALSCMSDLLWRGRAGFVWCEDIGDGAVERRRYAHGVSEMDHSAGQPPDLQGPAALQVMMHRRRHVVRHVIRERETPLGIIRRKIHTVSVSDRDDLPHDVE